MGSFFALIVMSVKRIKKRIVKVQEDETTIVELELAQHFLEFYKKETGHSKITQKGLSKFVNHLVELHRA
jgi:hypothetical protein